MGIWNYFPHDDMNGLSPAEKIKESMKNDPDAISAPMLNSKDPDAYFKLIDKAVLALSDEAEANLYKYIKKIGGGKKDLKELLSILSDPEEDPSYASIFLLKRSIDIAKKKKKNISMDIIQLAMRALMKCENYTSSKMPNGYYNSRMFQYVVEQVMDRNAHMLKGSKKRKGSRNTTVGFFESLIVFKALPMLHDATRDLCSDVGADTGIEEAAIHMTDWLAMTDIFELLAREDLNETALYLMGAARLIAETGDPKKPYKLLDKKLRKLIKGYGCSDRSYNSELKRLAEKDICNSVDPVMMMPYPGKEPNDCMENLKAIAPCLKLRPSVNSYKL